MALMGVLGRETRYAGRYKSAHEFTPAKMAMLFCRCEFIRTLLDDHPPPIAQRHRHKAFAGSGTGAAVVKTLLAQGASEMTIELSATRVARFALALSARRMRAN